MLAAIKMNNARVVLLAKADYANASQALESNDNLVDEILRSIRTISHLLHPPMLDEAGLSSAIRLYADEFSSRSGIKVNCECEGSAPRLPRELETALFRIVQECLGNVHRHSSSTTATVRFFLSGDKAHLEVRDAGRGIPPDRQHEIAIGGGGVGLRGVRERIAQARGELQITSDPSGTTIRVVAPINAAAAA
jgi:signal transduction histidine kinase